MKNAKKYESKIKKKLLTKLPQAPSQNNLTPVEVMVQAILQTNASDRQANKALAGIANDFVDLNELRVAPVKEIHDAIGKDYPQGRARMLGEVLNNIFNRTCKIDIDYITEMPKREKRRALTELGLDTFSEAMVSLFVFDTHAIPVDQDLRDCLEMDKLIEPGCELKDLQGFLERIITHKNAPLAHHALRQHVAHSAKNLAKFRKAQALIAEQLEAQAKEEAKVKAQAKALAKKKIRDKAKAVAVKAEKKAAKIAAKAKAKKTVNKTATKKAVKKTVKKTVKKAAKKTAKKTVKKSTKKTSGSKKTAKSKK